MHLDMSPQWICRMTYGNRVSKVHVRMRQLQSNLTPRSRLSVEKERKKRSSTSLQHLSQLRGDLTRMLAGALFNELRAEKVQLCPTMHAALHRFRVRRRQRRGRYEELALALIRNRLHGPPSSLSLSSTHFEVDHRRRRLRIR